MIDLLAFQRAVALVARAGGGGSSGGGGIAPIGYLPVHLLGAKIRTLQKKHATVFDTLQVAGWLAAVVYAIALTLMLRSIGFFAAIGAILGIKGLHEVSTACPDFNKKYQVYATNPEQATSLELLTLTTWSNWK